MTDSSNNVDNEIVQRAQQEPDAFEAVINCYQQQLFLYILKYIRDEAITEDIVQEAFIKMYINLQSFDLSKPFAAWAYRITHNEMVNHLRKHKTTSELNEEAQYDDLFDDRPDLLEEIDKNLQAEHIQKLVQQLPMKYREVIILHYFQNCDYETISTVISRPTATVGTRLKRAKEQLKKLYLEEAK